MIIDIRLARSDRHCSWGLALQRLALPAGRGVRRRHARGHMHELDSSSEPEPAGHDMSLGRL